MSDTICNLCKAIPLDLFRCELGQYKYELAPSFQDLEKSAQHGCVSCKIFVYTLQQATNTKIPIMLVNTSPRSPEQSRGIHIYFGHEVDSDTNTLKVYRTLNWLLHPGSQQEQMFGQVRYLPSSPVCDQNIELIKALLENCLADHPSCHVTEQHPLPTRLLDLGEDSDILMVRVVPGSRCFEHLGRYLSLSHCWGNAAINAPWKLTMDRTHEFSSGIPFNILPKTFQETINLVKSIGERYLWIDSMCIIQDSQEDWEVEASRMADVYGGSLCTISTATDSTSGGCYLPRDVAALQPAEWKLSQTDFRDDQQDTTVALFPNYYHGQYSPVFQRAWCLQERELSCRLLQFHAGGWRWSCSMGLTLETDLYTKAFDCRGRLRRSMTHKLTEKPSIPKGYQAGWMMGHPTFSHIAASKDRKKAYNYWNQIMSLFSSAKITFLDDRIPALHGLVARQEFLFPDKYAYGIWELDIINGLCWKCYSTRDGDVSTRTRIEPAIAPTWSFLSLQSAVWFMSAPKAIPDTYAWFEDTNEEIMFTAIRGRGHVVEMKCSDIKMTYHDPELSKYIRHVTVMNGQYGLLTYDTLRDIKMVGNLYLLLLRTRRARRMDFYGLAMFRVPWAKDGIPTFRRLGYYEGPVGDKGEPLEFRII